LEDFSKNDNDDDSNALDDDFVLDEEYKEEEQADIVLEEEEGTVGDNDPDLQEEYFQTPIKHIIRTSVITMSLLQW
jgi:Sec7-like guanine-nucleotide exchange factor